MTNMASDPDFDEQEQAEGERDTVDEALEHRPGPAPEAAGDGAKQGITNRPLAEEQREQQKLPPRGHAKDEGDLG
jgi:hypothetical protein